MVYIYQINSTHALTICELQVFGEPALGTSYFFLSARNIFPDIMAQCQINKDVLNYFSLENIQVAQALRCYLV